jgi:hypothetical protein
VELQIETPIKILLLSIVLVFAAVLLVLELVFVLVLVLELVLLQAPNDRVNPRAKITDRNFFIFLIPSLYYKFGSMRFVFICFNPFDKHVLCFATHTNLTLILL